jgi:hypothetical protein
MKKLIFLIALMAINYSVVFSQGCLPEGITFTTQEQIDNFQTNYPGCTEIEGEIQIFNQFGGTDISNLNGLGVLTSKGSNLVIFGIDSLTNLSGLDNLTSIGGSFEISVSSIKSLTGLGNLTSIGNNFLIGHNDSLNSLLGINNLQSIGGQLAIVSIDNLTNLEGLDALNYIGIGLGLEYNPILSSLENLNTDYIGSLYISYNNSLSVCDIPSVCNYLLNPNGYTEIHDNAPGCNSPEEVEEACLSSVEDNISNEEITLFPNPATSFITIHIKEGIAIEEAILYNHFGQKALVAVPVNNTVDVSNLKPGIYFLEITTKERSIRTKLVVE